MRITKEYVSNKEFLKSIIAYKEKLQQAKEENLTKPVIPRYIAECFMKISENLSYKPNFINYMFRDDMIGDGIEDCLKSVHKFNPEKSSNPFAYFTTIVYYAFLRRIAKEKGQQAVKLKILEKQGYDQLFYVDDENVNHSDMNYIKSNIQS